MFVNDIRAKVLDRTAPLAGALVWHGAEGGGGMAKIGFDLDASASVARLRNDDGTLGAGYIDSEGLTLVPGEPVNLDVVAYTANGYCEWVINLGLTVDGKPVPYEINHGGRRFRTTSIADRYAARYQPDYYTNRWVANGPGGFGT